MTNKDDAKNKWGGARDGAGRPPITNGKVVASNVKLTESQREFLKKKFGSISGGLRNLVNAAIAADMEASQPTETSVPLPPSE